MKDDEILDRAASKLMGAYRHTMPWNPDVKDDIREGHSIRVAERSGNRYRMGRRANDAVEAAVQIFVSGLDCYPIKSATEAVVGPRLAATRSHTPKATTDKIGA
jgi:hypothetical protein